MKALYVAISFIGMAVNLPVAVAGGSGWYFFEEEPARSELHRCDSANANYTPAKLMEHFDEIELPYRIENEKKDGSGQVISLVLVKQPHVKNPYIYSFFKKAEDCEAAYKIRKAELDKQLEPETKKKQKKYGAYQ